MIDPQELDIIRNESNIILKLIGDQFNNDTDILPDKINNNINDLFIHCFMNIRNALFSSTKPILIFPNQVL